MVLERLAFLPPPLQLLSCVLDDVMIMLWCLEEMVIGNGSERPVVLEAEVGGQLSWGCGRCDMDSIVVVSGVVASREVSAGCCERRGGQQSQKTGDAHVDAFTGRTEAGGQRMAPCTGVEGISRWV
jgi:hypothetical protein